MSAQNYSYDAATSFRAPASPALTATTTIGEVALDKLVNVRGSQKNKLGAKGYTLVLHIEAVDVVNVTDGVEGTTEESYELTVNTGVAGGAASKVAGFTPTPATLGTFAIALDAATVEKIDADHEVLALDLTAAGTAPSIKLSAWIV